MEKPESRLLLAVTGDADAVRGLLHDHSDKVMIALMSNRNVTEEGLLVIAKRRDVSSEVLGIIAGRKLVALAKQIRVALLNNPKTPRRTALGLLRFLDLTDLARATRNVQLPTELRQAVEGLLKERMPSVPLGMKVTLARMVSEDVLKVLLYEHDVQLIKACFENPMMRESVVIWAANHTKVSNTAIEHIAASPRWSAGKFVRYALVRNAKTPVVWSMEYVKTMLSADQRSLYNDPSVPVVVKVQLEIELEKKGERLAPPSPTGRLVGIPDEEEAESSDNDS